MPQPLPEKKFTARSQRGIARRKEAEERGEAFTELLPTQPRETE